MVRRMLATCVAVVAAVMVGAPAPASRAAAAGPHLSAAGTVPVYSYADAIRESVWVRSPVDSDGDGAGDRIAADLIRPRTAAGVRVPVIMLASPYYECCGRGNEAERKTYTADGTIASLPMHYDNYFVPRGYAVVAVDLVGTGRSTGCLDVGGPAEILGARAVVDWLNGRAAGFSAAGTPVQASRWSTGAVGMIGKSWDGATANGLATTGVPGLRTIVPIGAISSWYDYHRFNGRLRYDAWWSLHEGIGGSPGGACDEEFARIRAGSGETTGDLTAFWAQRDHRAAARAVRASVFVVHGVGDANVTTTQFGAWWQALADAGVRRRIWLFQAGHADPFDVRRSEWVRTLHRWFDHELHGVRNGADRQPRATVEVTPGVWREAPDWPAPGARTVSLRLGTGAGTGAGTLGPHAAAPGTTVAVGDVPRPEAELVDDPGTARDGRLAFLSAPLPRPVRVSGTPAVHLRIAVDRPTAPLSVRLVDYGTATRLDTLTTTGVRTLGTQSCWGESAGADDACYFDTEPATVVSGSGVLSRGFLDAAHHRTRTTTTPLTPGRWYRVTVPMDSTDMVVAAGHRLGLIVNQIDPEYTAGDGQGATVTVDLSASTVELGVSSHP